MGGPGECCNTLGSSANCQASILAGNALLFLIAILDIVLATAADDVSFRSIELLTIVLVWSLALFICIPRCCAPCCCQADMPDVPPPCPIRTPGWLDCPLLTGLWMAVIFGSIATLMEMLLAVGDLAFLRIARLIRIVWILCIMVGFGTGVWKFTLMKKGPLEGAASAAAPPTVKQITVMGQPVVGQPVAVQPESGKEGAEPVKTVS